MKPFLLKAPCKAYVWGGSRLRAFGKASDADRIAESWELSCHPEGESIIDSGEFAGMTLTGFLREHPEALGENCRKFDRFPVLIKLIDAREHLSVQVHPDDEYALSHEGELGKTEMWYVIDAQPGAEILYGFAKEVTREEFRLAIEENTLLDLVQRVPVKPGDVYFIPAGTLHAIGAGCLIAEVQENSNTTYRIYDYGRGRELHVNQALEVTRLIPMRAPEPQPEGVIPLTNTKYRRLAECRYFSANRVQVAGRFPLSQSEGSFEHWLCLDGSGVLHFEGGALAFAKGASIFVPCGAAVQGITGDCTLLYTTVDP